MSGSISKDGVVKIGQQWQYVLEIHDGRWVYVLRLVNVWMPVNIG